MVEIKLNRNIDDGAHYLKASCNYVIKKPEQVSFGCYGVSCCDPDAAFTQMMAVKKYFGKTSGNPLIHLIISYDDCVRDILDAVETSKSIVSYFTPRYQLIWALHHKERGCSKYHLHIVLNSVSYVDGKMAHTGIYEVNQFAQYVSSCTGAKTWVVFAKQDKE